MVGSSASKLALVLLVAVAGVAQGQSASDASRVLVVVNVNNSDGPTIWSYYRDKRKIPAANLVRVNVRPGDQISRANYENGILRPVRAAIAESRTPIDFIVMTKGIPIRLDDGAGYSVDGALAAMNLDFQPIPKDRTPTQEEVRRAVSPYFNKDEPFSSKKFGFYLVTRLDALTVADARRLVDLSLAAKPHRGPFLLDADPSKGSGGAAMMNESLSQAARVLTDRGMTVRHVTDPIFAGAEAPLAGYASWGSNDRDYNADVYRGLRFLPGALAETFVSTSGRTLIPRPFDGGQSLITDLITGGVTGVKGYVSEPYTLALARPNILYDRYTRGYNLAESFYMASPVLKWKDIVIGDPLCRPYPKR